MSDLYKQAAEFPLRLGGAQTALTYRDVVKLGDAGASLLWSSRRNPKLHPYRGVYLAGPGSPDLLDQLKALILLLPRGSAFGLHTAAQLHGFGVVASPRIHAVVPRGLPKAQLRGVAVHEAVLAFETQDVLGLPCVAAARCAIDLARLLPRREALPVLDAALFCGACTVDDLIAEAARHDRLRGVVQARELVALADARPMCRQESQARLLLRDHGLPVPVPQLHVPDADGFDRYVLDLGYPREQVGIEYDGSSHLDRARLRADRARHNWLEARGWAMRYLTDADLYRDPDPFLDSVRQALTTARRRLRANPPPPSIKE